MVAALPQGLEDKGCRPAPQMSERAPAAMNNYRDNRGRTHAHLLGGHAQATVPHRRVKTFRETENTYTAWWLITTTYCNKPELDFIVLSTALK